MRKISLHPYQVHTHSDRNGVRSLLIEAFLFFYNSVAAGHFYHAGNGFGVTLQHNKRCSQEDCLSLKQGGSLKDVESPMSLRTEGQVDTGEAAEAEKQLTFTNSVRKAIH